MTSIFECTFTRDAKKKNKKVWSDGIAYITGNSLRVTSRMKKDDEQFVLRVEFGPSALDAAKINDMQNGEEVTVSATMLVCLGDPINSVASSSSASASATTSATASSTTAPVARTGTHLPFKPPSASSSSSASSSAAILIMRPLIGAQQRGEAQRPLIGAHVPFKPPSSSLSTSNLYAGAKGSSVQHPSKANLSFGINISLPTHYDSTTLRRVLLISTAHQNLRSYCSEFVASIQEDILLNICQLMKGLESKTCAALGISSSSSSSGSEAAKRLSPQEVLTQLRLKGLPYLIHVGFHIKSPYKKDDRSFQKGGGWGKNRGKRKSGDEDGDGDGADEDQHAENVEPKAAADSFFMVLEDAKQRTAPKNCESFGRDDIWLLWRPESATRAASEVADSSTSIAKAQELRAQYVHMKTKCYPLPFAGGVVWQDAWLVRTNWHYFSGDGWSSVQFLSGTTSVPPAMGKLPAGKSWGLLDFKYSGIRLTNNEATNLSAIDILRHGMKPESELHSNPNPVMAHTFLRCNVVQSLIRAPGTAVAQVDESFPSLPPAVVHELADRVCQQFNLNADQRKVMARVETWFNGQGQQGNDIILVHGVFGSGKSHLLTAICVLISAVAGAWRTTLPPHKSRSSSVKVMLSSNTNVAVDRICSQLVKERANGAKGEHAANLDVPIVARLGNVSKIDSSLRKNLVFSHESANGIRLELERELKRQTDDSNDEKAFLQSLLAEASKPKGSFMESQIRMLSEAEVVGVTCASANSVHLRSHQFPILILDEASQITEPTSFLAMASAKPRFMIIVGDPKQLPPTLALPPKGGSKVHDLSMTLFDRLEALKWKSTMLSVQYRCHPRIADLCSKLFYDSSLSSGIETTDRPPLLDATPPIMTINCDGLETRFFDSCYNETEAKNILLVVGSLRKSGQGAASCSIGIICLYKEQANYLIRMLATDGAAASHSGDGGILRCSTVDAFQGQEMDVIIVATSINHTTSHLINPERINVALSRAKHHLIVVGNMKLLQTQSIWSEVLKASTLCKLQNGILTPILSIQSNCGPSKSSGPCRAAAATVVTTANTSSSSSSSSSSSRSSSSRSSVLRALVMPCPMVPSDDDILAMLGAMDAQEAAESESNPHVPPASILVLPLGLGPSHQPSRGTTSEEQPKAVEPTKVVEPKTTDFTEAVQESKGADVTATLNHSTQNVKNQSEINHISKKPKVAPQHKPLARAPQSVSVNTVRKRPMAAGGGASSNTNREASSATATEMDIVNVKEANYNDEPESSPDSQPTIRRNHGAWRRGL